MGTENRAAKKNHPASNAVERVSWKLKMSETENKMLITAVIPAYNSGNYIARAIDSVLAQTRLADEIIVVDDGSTDATVEVVRAYGDRVRLIEQANAGASSARNAGIQAATGDWIAFLDADDEWLPDKLRQQVEILHSCPHLVWVSGNYLRCLCNTDRRKAHISEAAARKAQAGKPYFDQFFSAFLRDTWGCTDTLLIQKETIQAAGLFDPNLRQMEDLDLWWKIAYQNPAIGYLPEPVAVYHLEIENSLIQSRTDYPACRDMIGRHLVLSHRLSCAKHVKACSATMLKCWMRSMLFDAQADEVRKTLVEFETLFSTPYKTMMRLLAWKPEWTAAGLRVISRVVRILKIRRQLTRKPPKRKP